MTANKPATDRRSGLASALLNYVRNVKGFNRCPVCGEQNCLEVAEGATREYSVCQFCKSEFQVYAAENDWIAFDY